MILYLLRHGEAEPRAATDAQRKLTAHGEQEVQAVARRFLESRLPLQCCLCSPYVRALQTAENFLSLVSPELPVRQEKLLTPEIRASVVMQMLDGLQEEQVLLVSHNPLMSELCALLTDGDISHMQILGTSELVAIEIDIMGLGMGNIVLRLLPEAGAAQLQN